MVSVNKLSFLVITAILMISCCHYSVIICPDKLYDSASRLRDYRSGQGYKIVIERLSDIPTSHYTVTAGDIHKWIENFSGNHSGLEYVTLIGDVALVPSFHGVMPDGTDYYSDFQYSKMEGQRNLVLPDIAVGRIPIKSPQDLDLYLQKVAKFESNFNGADLSHSPLHRILFFGDDDGGLSFYTDPGPQSTSHSAIAKAKGYCVLVEKDPSLEGLCDTLSSDSLAMVFYYGHGNADENSPLSETNISGWTNSACPVLYFSGGCDFDLSLDVPLTPPHEYAPGIPLGYALLLDSVGSVASIGTSRGGGYGYDDRFAYHVIELSTSKKTLGQLYNSALCAEYQDAMAANCDPGWELQFLARMNLIGDPALVLQK